MAIFNSYVSLPEGNVNCHFRWLNWMYLVSKAYVRAPQGAMPPKSGFIWYNTFYLVVLKFPLRRGARALPASPPSMNPFSEGHIELISSAEIWVTLKKTTDGISSGPRTANKLHFGSKSGFRILGMQFQLSVDIWTYLYRLIVALSQLVGVPACSFGTVISYIHYRRGEE